MKKKHPCKRIPRKPRSQSNSSRKWWHGRRNGNLRRLAKVLRVRFESKN